MENIEEANNKDNAVRQSVRDMEKINSQTVQGGKESVRESGRPLQTGIPPVYPTAGDVAPHVLQESAGRKKMKKHFSFFGAASAVYALFYTICLYRNASGITYPFFVVGTLFYFGLCMKKSGVPFKRESIFYVVSMVLLGSSVFLTDNQTVHLMTKTVIFLLFILLMLHQFYEDRKWDFGKYACAIGESLLETVGGVFLPLTDGLYWFRQREKEEIKQSKWRFVLLGILLALPVLVVVIGLLASADAVFRQMFVRIFRFTSFEDCILILLLFLAVLLISYSFIAMLNQHKIKEECPDRKKQEPVTAITISTLLTVVYLVFCFIQASYLFWGQMRLPEGYTWSSYARQGFFQLLAVCIINLVIVLICMSFFKDSRVLKIILTVMSICTYIMGASSAYRMLLYIKVYKLTFLRIFVLLSLVVIAFLLAGILLSIYRPGMRLFSYCVVVVTTASICLAFAKPDYWTARYNLAHIQKMVEQDPYEASLETAYQEIRYLRKLSADAAPALAGSEVTFIEYYENADKIREYFESRKADAEEMGVRDFNLSRYLAGHCLTEK